MARKKDNIIIRILSKIFLKEIEVKDGEKQFKANTISIIILIASIVAALCVLEKVGVIDDIVSMVSHKHGEKHLTK